MRKGIGQYDADNTQWTFCATWPQRRRRAARGGLDGVGSVRDSTAITTTAAPQASGRGLRLSAGFDSLAGGGG